MPTNSPIQHVVLIVKENHTFDNYFGTFPGANGESGLAHAADPPPSDPPHNHAAWLNRAQGAVRQQYVEADLPAYFAFARQYTLCDNYYTDVASQSDPNHLMLVTAASPIIDNHHRNDPPSLQPPFTLPSLPASLVAAGLDWRNYGGYIFKYIAGLHGQPHNVTSAQFQADVARGYLPAVSWLYAPAGLDEHPPHGAASGPVVGPGAQWTAQQVNAVAQSPLWASTAIFITWDDWGGWYDHVEPPEVEQWVNDGTSYANTQFRYGSRVGCLVVSPYAKRGYISTVLHSHVSLVKFCEMTFGLAPLDARDAAADGMADCFDYSQSPAPPPTA